MHRVSTQRQVYRVPVMSKTPMIHQQEAANKMAVSRFMGFWMKPRTGKTFAYLLGHQSHNAWPLLIICPLPIMASWLTELLDFGIAREDIQLVRPRTKSERLVTVKQQLMYDKKVFMVTYENLIPLDALYCRDPEARTPFSPRKVPRWLGLRDWRAVVADESYCIANYDAKVTQYCMQHKIPVYQIRNCLSGSPASESLLNFATQYFFMQGEYFGCKTYDEYLRKYWGYNRDTYERYLLNPAHAQEVFDYVHKYGYCKESLLKDPPVRYQTLDPCDKQVEILRWLNKATAYINKNGDECLMYPVVRSGMEERVAAGVHPITKEIISDVKIQQAVEIIRAHPGNALISTWYTTLIKPMQRALEAAGIPCRAITSDTPAHEREEIRLWFQSTPGASVVGQQGIISRGLDWSALVHLIHLSWFMGQEKWEQVNDRGKHPHRKDLYNIWALVTHKTGDRKRVRALGEKKYNSSAAIKELRLEIAADITKPKKWDY